MKKIIIGLTASVVLVFFALYYKKSHTASNQEDTHYPQIYAFVEAHAPVKALQGETIVFSDCDDTLISSPDYLPATFVIPTLLETLLVIKHPWLLLHSNCGEEVYSLMLERAPKMLVDDKAPEFFRSLIAEGFPFFAITGMESGCFGLIHHMPAWRCGVLKALGVPLSSELCNTTFYDLPAVKDNYPVFYKGLICCNRIDKGSVIFAFLDFYKLHPDNIVLFDDSIEELASLEQECNKRNIKAVCFHFKGAKNIKRRPQSLWRLYKQIEHLICHKEWLSDHVF